MRLANDMEWDDDGETIVEEIEDPESEIDDSWNSTSSDE